MKHSRISLDGADLEDPIVKEALAGFARRNIQPSNVIRTIAHSPELLRATLGNALALRHGTNIERRDFELIVMRTAHRVSGEYEAFQHRPLALAAGVTEDQLAAIGGEWRGRTLFNPAQRAMLAYVDAMTHGRNVDDPTFAAMKQYWTPRQIVEITLITANYMTASMVTNVLRIPRDALPSDGDTGQPTPDQGR
jgi:alkylhydroperoxidase family enzyme